MKSNYQVLSEKEKERIHDDSLKILLEVGVRYISEKALKILEQHGAIIDWKDKSAKIPGNLVQQALNSAPKSFTLGGTKPGVRLSAAIA